MPDKNQFYNLHMSNKFSWAERPELDQNMMWGKQWKGTKLTFNAETIILNISGAIQVMEGWPCCVILGISWQKTKEGYTDVFVTQELPTGPVWISLYLHYKLIYCYTVCRNKWTLNEEKHKLTSWLKRIEYM